MDRPDIRCPGKPHARLVSPGVWEVKCNSRVCGAGSGVVVLHRFSTEDGTLLKTLKFRDTPKVEEVVINASGTAAAVRSS